MNPLSETRARLDAAAAKATPVTAPAPEPSTQKLQVLDVEQMLRTPPPIVPWIADPVLIRGAVTMIAGREGQGKSLLALALAAALGHGREVAGIDCTTRAKTVVIDAENGQDEAHRRMHGLDVASSSLHYVIADNGFTLRTPGDREMLARTLRTFKPDVLVLDSFRSLALGMKENESDEVEAVLGPLRSMAREHRCAVLVLHHAGKDAGNGYRGSTAIGAAVDRGFTLTRHEEDPERAHRRVLRNWKARTGGEPDPLWFTIEPQHGGGIIVREAEAFVPEKSSPSTKEDEAADRIADLVNARGQMQWKDVCAELELHPEEGTAKRARDKAADAGMITRPKRGFLGPAIPSGQVAGSADVPSGQPTVLGVWPDRTEANANGGAA